MMWALWAVGAGALTVVSGLMPSCAWASGLVVGGALSHAAEVSLRGSVCDYVCLRFWAGCRLCCGCHWQQCGLWRVRYRWGFIR